MGGAGLQFQKLSPLLSWWEHGSVQASMMLETELRVLHLVCHTECALSNLRPPNPPPLGHASFNMVTPPISATPYGPTTQTHESMGAVPIQT